jgi:hypothetical protein
LAGSAWLLAGCWLAARWLLAGCLLAGFWLAAGCLDGLLLAGCWLVARFLLLDHETLYLVLLRAFLLRLSPVVASQRLLSACLPSPSRLPPAS